MSGPLDRYANNSSTPGQSTSPARDQWYALRAYLWHLSGLPRVRKCGKTRRAAEVGLRVTDGVAGFSGLVTCGSVWVCPVCSRKIAARRALEVGAAVAQAVAGGHTVVFLTLTLRHHHGQGLGGLWDAVSGCWTVAAGKGRAARSDVEVFGLLGYVRSTEVTHGDRNGWHPHTHAVLVLDGPVSDEAIETYCGRLFDRWRDHAVSVGLDAPARIGQDWQRVTPTDIAKVSEYLGKTHKELDPSRIGLEVAFTQSKRARSAHSTRSMWEVLDAAVTDGDAADVAAWREWERVSKGRRALNWSRSMRELFGPEEDLTDEEIAAEVLGTEADTLVWITGRGWSTCVGRPELIPGLLNAAETGVGDLRRFLHVNGIEYRVG